MTEVLVVYPHDNLSSNPTMVGLVCDLARRGVSVGVMAPMPLSLDGWGFDSFASKVTSLPLPALFPSRPTGLRSAWRAFAETRQAATLGRYAAIVGVDPVGIAIASRL